MVWCAELGLDHVISLFCGTVVMQNAKITWKSSSSGCHVAVKQVWPLILCISIGYSNWMIAPGPYVGVGDFHVKTQLSICVRRVESGIDWGIFQPLLSMLQGSKHWGQTGWNSLCSSLIYQYINIEKYIRIWEPWMNTEKSNPCLSPVFSSLEHGQQGLDFSCRSQISLYKRRVKSGINKENSSPYIR